MNDDRVARALLVALKAAVAVLEQELGADAASALASVLPVSVPVPLPVPARKRVPIRTPPPPSDKPLSDLARMRAAKALRRNGIPT